MNFDEIQLLNRQNIKKRKQNIKHQQYAIKMIKKWDKYYLSKCKKYDNIIYLDGFIYLIREREFINTNEEVYKVGATVQKGTTLQLTRLKNYKKGSQLLCACRCDPIIVFEIESKIKKIFKEKFVKHGDGTEYFIGEPLKMLEIIYLVPSGRLKKV